MSKLTDIEIYNEIVQFIIEIIVDNIPSMHERVIFTTSFSLNLAVDTLINLGMNNSTNKKSFNKFVDKEIVKFLAHCIKKIKEKYDEDLHISQLKDNS